MGLFLEGKAARVPRPRMVDLYLHFPISLHGLVLNELSKGTNLYFIYVLGFPHPKMRLKDKS
jgi:hypothetical protein